MVTRFEGEAIVIDCPNGDQIKVTLCNIRTAFNGENLKRKKARVAVEAPLEYRILRSELVEVAGKKGTP